MLKVDRAVILVNEATCQKVLLGLTLLDRAIKTARREGAKDILLISRTRIVEAPDVTVVDPTDKGALGVWFKTPGSVLIMSDNVILSNLREGWTVGDGVLTIGRCEELRVELEQGVPLDKLVGGRAKLPKATLAEVEKLLLRSMIKPSDGYFARWFDRKISLAISRMLVRTPITPNVISFVTMLIGLTGAWLISLETYWAGVAGTAVFALSTILDGCDGEVARLKFQQSPFGSILDAVIDNVVYLSVMVSIAYVSIRANPETNYYLLFGLLAAGMAVTTAVIFGWMNRVRDSSRAQLFLERLANGDFSYLVLGFAVAGHLEYFLWAAAFGVHAFYLILIAILVWR